MDSNFWVDIMRGAKDSGFLPVVWIVFAIMILNKIPMLKHFLFYEIKRSMKAVSSDTDAIDTGRKKQNGFILRDDCHRAMDALHQDIHTLRTEVSATGAKVDTLTGYIRGKLGE